MRTRCLMTAAFSLALSVPVPAAERKPDVIVYGATAGGVIAAIAAACEGKSVLGPDGSVLNEGDFQERVSPYAILYRSLTPKAGECDNLLVPVCMSASHVAYGTIRMEPVYMILGQACGVAAALAVDGKTSVQEVPVGKLTALLKKQKAVLSP